MGWGPWPGLLMPFSVATSAALVWRQLSWAGRWADCPLGLPVVPWQCPPGLSEGTYCPDASSVISFSCFRSLSGKLSELSRTLHVGSGEDEGGEDVPNSVVLKWGKFCPPRDFGKAWRHFWLSQWGYGSHHVVARAQGCPKHPTGHKTGRHNKRCLVQSIDTAEVENPGVNPDCRARLLCLANSQVVVKCHFYTGTPWSVVQAKRLGICYLRSGSSPCLGGIVAPTCVAGLWPSSEPWRGRRCLGFRVRAGLVADRP